MKRFLLILLASAAMFSLPSCSLHLLGHSKNGAYMGMSSATQGTGGNTYVPKQVQRQEPIF